MSDRDVFGLDTFSFVMDKCERGDVGSNVLCELLWHWSVTCVQIRYSLLWWNVSCNNIRSTDMLNLLDFSELNVNSGFRA